jgi:hypothetical protein
LIYFLALIPATILTIAGYFVIYVSNQSQGAFATFGRYLGFWAFTLASLVILGAIFAAAQGGARRAMMFRGGPGYMMRGGPGLMMDRFGNRFPSQPPGQSTAPPIAPQPSAPAPSNP